jgi:hypothetical protein
MAIGGAFPQLSAMSSPPRLRLIRLGESLAARRVFERVMKPVVVRFPEPIDQFEGFPL